MKKGIWRRNLNIGSICKFAFTLFVIGLLIGCTKKETQQSYNLKYLELREEAAKKCSSLGKLYLAHFTPDLESWEVICYQESPVKFFHYQI